MGYRPVAPRAALFSCPFLLKAALASTSGLALAVLASQGAWAQAAAPEGQQVQKQETLTELDAITVTADRVPGKIYDAPATVSIKTDRDIDRDNIHTPADLVRNEPGVSIGNQPTRGGATNYTIRGIGDNRVRLQIDGLKIPDFPGSNIGAGTYTRDFVDFDSLRQVEIIRGPASALYGSDAIGGVVSFVTKDPADYLNMVGKDWFASGKLAYDSADRSFAQTVTAAGRVGPWESLILYTHRRGKQTAINSWRVPNPQDYEAHNLLAKLIYNSPELGQFKFTAEYLYKTVDTNILTDLSATVRDSRGKDDTSRPRFSFDWNLPVQWAIADNVKTNLYWTEADRREGTTQLRGAGGPAATLRRSDFGFQQQIAGGDIQLTLNRNWFGWQHNITYGAVYDFTTTTRPRFRTDTNLSTGVSTNLIGGETFPNKNFPDTETTQGALYIQDIAQHGPWRVIPALRLDYYHLDPKPDALSANGSTFTLHSLTKYALSPKLGVTYDLNEHYRLFAQYAHGFRAPPYDNANFAYSNPMYGYEILPNGNLKPETSNSFEGGLRGRFDDGSSFQLTAFYNMYRDFIDTVVVSPGPPATPLMQFQYQNLSRVRIYGFEAKGEYRVTPDWSVYGAFAYANGQDQKTKQAINSVDPFTLTTGVRYENPQGWGGELRAKFAASQNRVSDPSIVKTKGYAVIDVLGHYNFTKTFSINAGVYNLFDEKYFNHADVAGTAANNPNLELFRSPGRTFAVNATVRF